jgi:transcriptional regulator with XRE-family HTH domain
MAKRSKRGLELRRVLAENVRAFRWQKKLSQEELAEICGLHRTYVGSVERAERNVTLSTLEAFATALSISVPDLLTKRVSHDEQ